MQGNDGDPSPHPPGPFRTSELQQTQLQRCDEIIDSDTLSNTFSQPPHDHLRARQPCVLDGLIKALRKTSNGIGCAQIESPRACLLPLRCHCEQTSTSRPHCVLSRQRFPRGQANRHPHTCFFACDNKKRQMATQHQHASTKIATVRPHPIHRQRPINSDDEVQRMYIDVLMHCSLTAGLQRDFTIGTCCIEGGLITFGRCRLQNAPDSHWHWPWHALAA